jgi:capsular polysaccharide biosynthesis protein
VAEFLGARGFERIEDTVLNAMSLREQAALFASAEVLVSPHGSQLSNTYFCRPGFVLVECFKFTWMDCAQLGVVRSTGQAAEYRYVVDWSPYETAREVIKFARIRADLQKLGAMVAEWA